MVIAGLPSPPIMVRRRGGTSEGVGPSFDLFNQAIIAMHLAGKQQRCMPRCTGRLASGRRSLARLVTPFKVEGRHEARFALGPTALLGAIMKHAGAQSHVKDTMHTMLQM